MIKRAPWVIDTEDNRLSQKTYEAVRKFEDRVETEHLLTELRRRLINKGGV